MSGILKKLKKMFTPAIHQETQQVKNSTSFDRYPEVFSQLKELLKDNAKINALSFGCSTGEECFSILKYFESANVVGVDISEYNLKKCREKLHPQIKYLISNKKNIANNGPYDIIFAMSVFCRWPDTMNQNNISSIYSFDKYDEMVVMVASNLKVGGYIVLFNSNYNFMDSSEGKNFSAVKIPVVKDKEFVHKFDKHGTRVHEIKENEFILYKRIK